MKRAVIVSTARTGLAKSWKGALNMTHGASLGGHAVQHAVQRSGVDPARIEDVLMGCSLPEGTTGGNIARVIALRAGLPITAGGVTINRFCSSGLQTIALAAQRIMTGECEVLVAGGVESISLVQNDANMRLAIDPVMKAEKPAIYWSMLETAECVARRYAIPRDAMDEYGARSQQRAAAAEAAGLFKAEIAPMAVTMGIVDPDTRRIGMRDVVLDRDEGIRPGTTVEAISGLRSALQGGLVTAGNASQFSDGASACVVMDEKAAEQAGLAPLGIFRGFAVAGCEPDENPIEHMQLNLGDVVRPFALACFCSALNTMAGSLKGESPTSARGPDGRAGSAGPRAATPRADRRPAARPSKP